MKKSATFLSDYRKIFSFLMVFFLASFQANSTNPVISNFLTNLSAMVNQEAIYDIKPEMIIEGNTIHVVWIEKRSDNNKLYYCRSTDLGKTWQTPILIADQTYIDGDSNRKLAVDGNNVHIAIGMGSVVYYARSTNGGSSFEPGRELVSKPGDGNLRNFQIRAANGKVAIAYQGTPSAKNGLFMLSSIDGGLTFTDKLITTQSTRLSDFWYDGAQMVVVSEYSFAAGGWNIDTRVFVSVSNDNGSSFTTQKIVYTNEAGDEITARCYHGNHYVPKIAKSGNNIHIIFIGNIINDERTTLYARSTDNGQTFEKAKDINNGILHAYELDLLMETVAAKNNHVYLEYSSKGKVYFLQSADNGNTFSTAKSILPEGYSYVGSTGYPGLLIDPTDASGSTVYIYGNAMFSIKSTDGGNTFSECMVVVPIHENIRSIQSDLVIDSNGNKHWISEACWWEGTDTDIFYKFVGPQPAPGTKNKSLFFELVYNSKVDVAIVPSSPSLDFDSALTAEAWVKFDLASIAENSVDIGFFAKVNGADNSNWNVPGGFMMGSRKRFGKMTIYSAIGTDKGNFSNVDMWNPVIGDTLWHHVAFTYDANGGLNNFKTYVDGLLKIQQTVTGEINQGNGLFMIGARPDGSFGNSKYQIDNIRLWNRALTQDELLQNQLKTFTGKEDSLKLFLNFDDTFKDISGNGNDAIPLYWGILKESDFNPPIPDFDLYQSMNQVSLTNKTQNGTAYSWNFGDGTVSDKGNPVYSYANPGEYTISLEASNANSKTAIIKKATIVGLDRIEPIQAGNGGYSSISVFGGGLIADGTSVSLRKTGSSDIVGENLFSPGLGALSAQFYLEDAQLGKWDVIVKKGTSEQILKEAFEVVQAVEAEPWASISGRSAVLVNMWQTYTITYGNNGNIDAYGVPLYLSITDDEDIEIEFIDFEMEAPDYAIELGKAKEVTDQDKYFTTDLVQGESFKARVYPILIPVIPANSTSSIHIRLKSPKNFQMRLLTGLPLYELTADSSSLSTKSTTDVQAIRLSSAECLVAALLQEVQDVAITGGLEELKRRYACYYKFGYWAIDTRNQFWDNKLKVKNVSWNLFFVGLECALAYSKIATAARITLSLIISGVKNYYALKECERTGVFKGDRIQGVFTFVSFDPNEMIGPAGFSDKHWIQKNNTIPYTILFENKSTATAPAHIVTVTDTLDLEKFDLKEFGFGSFGFGDTTLAPNGKKLKQFSMDVNLNPKMNLIARISGKLDTISGVVRWEFLSLNPTNMELEEDPFIGFLPPNNTERAGEGYVSFSVGLKKELGTSAALKNKASIVFDANTPILTNEFTNTLDLDKPQSQVYPLDATIDSRFPLSWTGSDVGSGIASYSVYVLENDTALSAWKLNTPLMTAEFIGNVGSKYKFYSVATDNVSLIEDDPSLYDASTQITVHVEEFEMKKDEIQVFPNPVTDKLTISLANAPCGMYVVELVGINGQVCYSEIHDDFSISKGIQIGVEGYRSGQYLVRMVYVNKSVTRKVMIR